MKKFIIFGFSLLSVALSLSFIVLRHFNKNFQNDLDISSTKKSLLLFSETHTQIYTILKVFVIKIFGLRSEIYTYILPLKKEQNLP